MFYCLHYEIRSDSLAREEKIGEVLEQLSLYEDLDLELFLAFVELAGYDLLEENIGEILGKLTECFHGRYESEEEYATMLINECYKLPKFERKYFDYGHIVEICFQRSVITIRILKRCLVTIIRSI